MESTHTNIGSIELENNFITNEVEELFKLKNYGSMPRSICIDFYKRNDNKEDGDEKEDEDEDDENDEDEDDKDEDDEDEDDEDDLWDDEDDGGDEYDEWDYEYND